MNFFRRSLWARKQKLAKPSRYYGNGGTIHSSGHLDIVLRDDKVVEVWYRCQMLPFELHGASYVPENSTVPVKITGIELLDERAL